MSTDELRRLLDYPDDSVFIDVAAVAVRARRLRRRRRTAFGAASALAVAIAVYAVAWSAPSTQVSVLTPADDSLPSAGPSASASDGAVVTSTPAASQDPARVLIQASGGEHVSLGHGWEAWVRAGGDLCRSEPSDSGVGHRFQPFGCRSTTDGNIGGLGMQSASASTGTMYSAVIPYANARVDVVIGGKHYQAATVHFDRLNDWTFYYLWVPSDAVDQAAAENAGVVAYDDQGKTLARMNTR
jgi:hypothetical protein